MKRINSRPIDTAGGAHTIGHDANGDPKGFVGYLDTADNEFMVPLDTDMNPIGDHAFSTIEAVYRRVVAHHNRTS